MDYSPSDLRDITIAVKDGRYRATGIGDYYRYGGGTYKLTPELSATYFYGELDDVYRQQFAGLIHNTRLGNGALTTDLRAFTSRDVGAAKAGEVDNQAYAAALGYSYTHDFDSASERSWQLRYGYDCAGMGIPGLSFLPRTSVEMD